jgi:hypothetical protein
MEKDIKKWAEKVYGGTTYRLKTFLVAYNSEFSLFNKKSSTEYVGRFSPSVYSESEWFVLKNFDESQELRAFPENVALFHKTGRLLKSDADFIKEKFNLEAPKKEKKQTEKLENKSVIFIEKNIFSFSLGVYEIAKYSKFVNEDDKNFNIITKNGEKKSFSKNKYNIKIVDSIDAEKITKELNEQLKNFNDKIKEANNIRSNFLKQFNK